MLRSFLQAMVWCGCLAWVDMASAQTDPNADLLQAVEFHQSGNYAAAIDGYQRFLKTHPEAAAVRSNLGAALAHEGRFEEAIREYSLALGVNPKNVPVRLNLALAYYKSGDLAQAIGQLEKVHSADPKNMQAAELLGPAIWPRGRTPR